MLYQEKLMKLFSKNGVITKRFIKVYLQNFKKTSQTILIKKFNSTQGSKKWKNLIENWFSKIIIFFKKCIVFIKVMATYLKKNLELVDKV